MRNIRSLIDHRTIAVIMLILFMLGALLLMGSCEPKSIEIRDELGSLIDAYGLAWNGTQLVTIRYELEIQTDYLAVKYEEPVASASILLPSRILDKEPEYFLMRSTLRGDTDFIYGVTVIKVLGVGSSPPSESTHPILFSQHEKDTQDFLRVDVYSLKGAKRDSQISRQVSDSIQFFTSNRTLLQAHTNLIKEVRISEFRSVCATDGLVSQGTISQTQLLAVIPYAGLMILFPIIFLCVSKLKYKRLLDVKWVIPIGVALRVMLSVFTGHAYDVEIWKFAVRGFYEHGEIALFTNWTSPPIFYFALILLYLPYALLHYCVGFGDWRAFYHPVRAVESSFIKLPMIIADVIIFILLTKIIHHIKPSLNKEQIVFWGSLYFLNPYIIMVSSVWGMFDALAMAFMVAGIYMWVKKRYLLAGFLFAISACTKWIGVAPLLFGTILLLRRKRFKTAITMATTSASVILTLFALPFIAANQTSFMLEVLAFRSGKGSDVITWHGVTYLEYFRLQNVFDIFPDWLVSNYLFIILGVFSATLFVIIARLDLRNHRAEAFTLVKSTLLAFLAFYLAYHRINHQFLLWGVALVPILLCSSEDKVIKYPVLGWMIVGMIPGVSSYMLFGVVGPERLVRLLRPYEVGFSVIFSFLCMVALWLLLGIGKRLSIRFSYMKAEVLRVIPNIQALVYITWIVFVCVLSLGLTQTIPAKITPPLAFATVVILFFLVAPLVAAFIESVEHDAAKDFLETKG